MLVRSEVRIYKAAMEVLPHKMLDVQLDVPQENLGTYVLVTLLDTLLSTTMAESKRNDNKGKAGDNSG